MANSIAVESTKRWINDVVIGFNFCPFAKREVMQNSIRYVDYNERKLKPLIVLLAKEIAHLEWHEEVETTLIVLSSGFKVFWDYLDVVDKADNWLDNNQFRGKYQIASFHPEYCFAGENIDSPSNYTNRSPYPMLHILRESSLEDAIARYKNPENIPLNNVDKANAMGTSALQALLRNCIEG